MGITKEHIILLLLFPLTGFCQQGKIFGIVTDSSNTPLAGTHIYNKNTSQSTISDNEGMFELKNLPLQPQKIQISYTGFSSKTITVSLSAKVQTKKVKISLSENTEMLNEVILNSNSDAKKLKESSQIVSLIKANDFKHRSIATKDLLGVASGVQIRESGGIGNNAEISIQGLTGKQVKLFLDGIPLEFLFPVQEFGIGPSLAMLPIQTIKQIEVYKGTVPVHLGSDALGGSIHIISKSEQFDFIEGTQGFSSFNTWQTTISGRKVLKNNWSIGVNGFYTDTDNNYEINNVQVINENGNPEFINSNKFHDAFSSYSVQANINTSSKKWADYSSLKFVLAGFDDEIQHNFEMRQPYGEATNSASSLSTIFDYRKKELFKNLNLETQWSYNFLTSKFRDTSLNIYDWTGNIVGQRVSGGEITTSGNDLTYRANTYSGRFLLEYNPKENTQVYLNTTSSFFHRTGKDPVANAYYQQDFFQTPTEVIKNVVGIGVSKKVLNEKLHSNSSVKWYYYDASGPNVGNSDITQQETNDAAFGVGQSFSFKVSNSWLLKASYEYATRLPDRTESLGDFRFGIASNLNLSPERSHNANLEINLTKKRWNLSLNGFLRSVSNIIILQPVPPPVLPSYENLLKARILGAEGSLSYSPIRAITIRSSLTYQQSTDRSEKDKAGVSSNRYFEEQLPNRPTLFGNGEINSKHKNILHKEDSLSFWWRTNYVKTFFRYWEIDGREEDKLKIPTQWLHQIGMSYTDQNKHYTFSLETHNLFDTEAYDNFGVQKPGRSLHLKIRTYFN
ncbi:TonB-dependent receptor [Aquimarina sp. 2201CG1-2-11]|uniref:TonB-dependent receptor n=1 Tax=Aquimarina discodermiae TaxID=3231043 RepID=UPI0034627FAB